MKDIKFAIVGRSSIKKDVVESKDFVAAKEGDLSAALRIVEQNWKDFKTEQLQEILSANAVFLSQPSTSGSNVIPLILASKLGHKLNRPVFNGDEIFNALHTISSKEIPRDKRIFKRREYSLSDNGEAVGPLLKGKNIVIVDDILTTGSSVRCFKEFLNEENLYVSHIVVLMGDRRLEMDPKTKDKLSTALKEKNIDFDINKLDYITRLEAGGLIRTLNSLRNENEIEKFTKDLQGLQRDRIAPGFRRDTVNERNKSTEGKNIGNEGVGKKIPPGTSISVQNEIRIQKVEKKTDIER